MTIENLTLCQQAAPQLTIDVVTVYGLGVSYNINQKWAATSDFTSTVSVATEMTKTSALGFGLRYKF